MTGRNVEFSADAFRIVRGAAFFLFLLVAASGKAWALDPHKRLTQYIHDAWSDQLPQSTIHAVTRSRDGYLWLGTFEGLARFDGVKFTVFDTTNTPELKSDGIYALAEDQAGVLWIGTNLGLSRYRDGAFSTLTVKDGLPGNVVWALLENQAGLWVGTDNGLGLYREGKFVKTYGRDLLPYRSVRALCDDRRGGLWIVMDNGDLACLKDDAIKVYTTRDGLPGNQVRSLYCDRAGNLWIGFLDGGLCRFHDGQCTTYTTKDGLPADGVSVIVEDRGGNLWIGTTGKGLGRMVNGKFESFGTGAEGLADNRIRTLFEDAEGNLWIGTNAGLHRLRDGVFTRFTTREGLSHDYVRVLCESRDGDLWIGSDGGGLCRLRNGVVSAVYKTGDGLPHDFVRALFEDPDGTLWVGTTGGLCRFKDGRFTAYGIKDGLAHPTVRSMCRDLDGNLWITTDQGLNRFKDGIFTTYTTKDGLSHNALGQCFTDRAGNVWIATANGICRYADGAFTTFLKPDGAAENIVFGFYEDAEGSLWIGTKTSGLVRMRGDRVTSYTTKDGLFDDTAFAVVEDDDGNLWMSCNRGVYRVNKKDLDLFDQGVIRTIPCTAYGKLDGLGTNQCNGAAYPCGLKTRDGRLWFATVRGAATVDSRRVPFNDIPPAVLIERFMANQQACATHDRPEIPSGRELEFCYTATSLAIPEKVRFKYRLDGFDADWKTTDQRTVVYTNIPSGLYRFQVLACNNDGLWNEKGAEFRFEIPTPVWRRWWAYCLYGLGVVGLAYGGAHLRVKALAVRNRALEEKVRERTVALAEKNRELAATIDELEASRRKAFESERRALEAGRAKSMFLANMSHELRTPLNAILGFAQIMERQANRVPRDREVLSVILRSGEYLLGLINDVLSISKIEAGKFTLAERPFHFVRFVESIEDMFRQRAEAKRLRFIVRLGTNLPELVLGDEGKLRQILVNLLGNAMKFTERGHVVLWVNWKNDRGSFEVEDTGPGIAKAELKDLFQPFSQTRSGQQAREGTGLGLVISRDFVRLMGGELTVSSEVDKGATFRFEITLPATDASEAPIRPRRKVVGLEPGQPPFRILTVDDKSENRMLLRMLFAPFGFDVLEASDGLEAVAVWRAHRPNVIFMDMRMPRLDGYEAVKTIRRMEETEGQGDKETRRRGDGEAWNDSAVLSENSSPVTRHSSRSSVIIGLSASAFEQDREAILAAGCNDFIAKPFREDELFDKLTEHLGVRFRHEEEIAPPAPIPPHQSQSLVSLDSLSRVPGELLSTLETAATVGDKQAALRTIDRIRESDQTTAGHLRNLIENVKFDEVLSLIEEVREGKS